MLMVEAPSYFEAYKHVLEGMKEVASIPMCEYIVKVKGAVRPPRYLQNDVEVKYDLRSCRNPHLDDGPSDLHRVPILKKYQVQ